MVVCHQGSLSWWYFIRIASQGGIFIRVAFQVVAPQGGITSGQSSHSMFFHEGDLSCMCSLTRVFLLSGWSLIRMALIKVVLIKVVSSGHSSEWSNQGTRQGGLIRALIRVVSSGHSSGWSHQGTHQGGLSSGWL